MQQTNGLRILSCFDGISCGKVALQRAGIPVTQYIASEINKYAITVSRANHPDIIQGGDVRVIRMMAEAGFFGHIDLVIAGSPCFVADTKIICQNNIKSIQDVKTGDVVLTHKNVYQKVKRVGGTDKEIYTLTAQGGIPINTTKEHPFYIRKKITHWNNEKRTYEARFTNPLWVKLKDIKTGDYVGTPILKTCKNPLKLTHEECFVLGLYLGDGHTRKDYKISKNRHWQLIISTGSHEIEELKSKLRLKYSCFKHTQNVYRVVFSNKRLVEIVEKHIGTNSNDKTISKTILDLPNDLLESFLNGYEFSDGSSRNNVFRATTVSKQLINSLSLLIAKLYKTTCCIEYTARPKKTIIQDRIVNQKNTWTISYRKTHTKQSRAWLIDGILWNPVKSVNKTNSVQKVYNIEVENDNSYIADGRIVHNCQGFSFAGKQLAFNDPRSSLFFEFVAILNALRRANPNIKFLLENVKMKKEYLDVITTFLGVQPILINSALVSAQSRQRYYWCNWLIAQPEDRQILLKNIIEHGFVDRDKSYCIDANYFKGGNLEQYFNKSRRQLVFNYSSSGRGNGVVESRHYEADKALTLTSQGYSRRGFTGVIENAQIRKLTPIECERLQTLPDNYTSSVSNSQRYRQLGNGMTVDIIAHIFRSMPR